MSNQVGDCFKFLWPFQNVRTLTFSYEKVINPPWIQNFHAAAEDGVVRWLVPANNRLSHFRRDENLKKERIKNKTSHTLQAKNNPFLCKCCYIFALEVQKFAD